MSPQTKTAPQASVERLSPRTNDYIEILYHWQRYLVAGQIAQGKNILDAACGEGYGADHLAGFAARVDAIDIDANAIEQARAKYRRDNLHFQRGSIDQLPFAAGSFDLVTSFETIEHVSADKQEQFLAEIVRVLKPGGRLLISTPNKRRTEKFAEKNPYHVKEFYLEEFTGFLGRSFKHVDCWLQEINLATFSWKPGEQGSTRAPWNTLTWEEGAYRPAAAAMGDFLYVVAVCSNDVDQASSDLHSVCFDVTRQPLETLWHDHLVRIDEAQRDLRAARSSLQDLELQVKRLSAALAVAKSENGTISQVVADKEAAIRGLRGELETIRAMRSWRLVEAYRDLMDNSPFRRVLGPVRDKLFKRP